MGGSGPRDYPNLKASNEFVLSVINPTFPAVTSVTGDKDKKKQNKCNECFVPLSMKVTQTDECIKIDFSSAYLLMSHKHQNLNEYEMKEERDCANVIENFAGKKFLYFKRTPFYSGTIGTAVASETYNSWFISHQQKEHLIVIFEN